MDIQIPLKWYYILLLVIPALISAFLVKPELKTESGQCEKNRREHQNQEIRNWGGFKFLGGLLCQFLITCAVYVGIFAFAILIYAIIRYFRMGQSNPAIIFSIWWSFVASYVPTHLAEMVLIPFVTTVAASRIHSWSWNVIISVVLAIVLILASVFTNTEVRHILPMEEEILAELKSQPIFDYSISDISGFREMVNAGYGVTDEEGEESENPDRPSELDLDMETLLVSQLLLCMDYLFGNDSELCREYAKRAYYFYQSGTVTDHHDAGRVLFYYAYYYEYPDYLKAADEFESAEEYNNAVLCLWYYCGREKGAFRDLTGRIVDDAIKAVESGRTSKSLKWTQEILMDWYSQAPYDSWPEDFDRLCSAAPDEAFISIVNASVHLYKGDRRDLDAERIEHLLTLEKYKNCPKALLLSQNYGHEHIAELYQLFLSHPDWFEEEDKNNLSWLFYERGEYEVAISIGNSERLSERDERNESVAEKLSDGGELLSENSMNKSETGGTIENFNAILIRTEAFLQNPDREEDIETLYVGISKAIESGAGEYEVRLRLAQIIIGNRLGLQVSYEGLSDICQEVFRTDSPTGVFIVSSLKNVDGRYEEAYVLTNSILEKINAPDQLYYRTLFLQADALMGMASLPEYSGQAAECYDRAATILESIRDSMEGDYISCLERLVKVYRATGRDDEANSTQELLTTITGGRF